MGFFTRFKFGANIPQNYRVIPDNLARLPRHSEEIFNGWLVAGKKNERTDNCIELLTNYARIWTG